MKGEPTLCPAIWFYTELLLLLGSFFLTPRWNLPSCNFNLLFHVLQPEIQEVMASLSVTFFQELEECYHIPSQLSVLKTKHKDFLQYFYRGLNF